MSLFLAPADKKRFLNDGFLVCPEMYSEREMIDLSNWSNRLATITPKKGEEMFYSDVSLLDPQTRIINRIEYFAYRDRYIQEFIFGEKMMKLVQFVLGEDAHLFKEKINFKLSGGGGFKPHQDIQPGWDDYAPYFVSILVAMDDSLEENGCFELAKGHHKRGCIGRRFEPLEGKELDGIEFKKYPMKAGDAVIFDCFVPHQSSPNLSGKPRRNLYVTYNRESDGDHREQYFKDKRANYPPDHEREVGKSYQFRV